MKIKLKQHIKARYNCLPSWLGLDPVLVLEEEILRVSCSWAKSPDPAGVSETKCSKYCKDDLCLTHEVITDYAVSVIHLEERQ